MFLLLLFVVLLAVNLFVWRDISFRNTPPPSRPGDPNGGVVYLRIVLPLEEVSRFFFSLFVEWDYPRNVTMWLFFHLLSTLQYSSRSKPSGHACWYTTMNRLEFRFLCASLFVEWDYPRNVTMWLLFHLFSTLQYSSRSKPSGHACWYTTTNRLEFRFLWASSRCWCGWLRHQRNLYLISRLLSTSLHLVPIRLICVTWHTLHVTMLPPA